MKFLSILDTKRDGSLRVNKCIVFFTSQQSNSNSYKKDGQEDVISSNHIAIQECEDLNSKIQLVETLDSVKDGGQAIVNDLKNLNLRTAKEPSIIYVSSLLTLEKK